MDAILPLPPAPTRRRTRFRTGQLLTPKGEEIQKSGIRPDVSCRPPVVVRERFEPGAAGGSRVDALRQDPCVKLALQQLSAAGAAAPAGLGI